MRTLLSATPSYDLVMAGVTLDDVRGEALTLPRSYEALVADRVKFRVGRIVYLAASRDETLLGFAFPKEEREALVEAEPEKFLLPKQADMRYHWAVVRLAAIDGEELSEIVFHAWRMVVPKSLVAEVAMRRGIESGPSTPE